jgi:hypothetical protein
VHIKRLRQFRQGLVALSAANATFALYAVRFLLGRFITAP